MTNEIENTVAQVHMAKRMLTIESYINGYYNCDTRAVGKKTKKYINVEQLGLIPIVYKRLFGDTSKPVPYKVLAEMLGRERTSGLNWERKAQGYLDVYPQKKLLFEGFLENNKEDMLKDCGLNNRLVSRCFVRVIATFGSEKFEPKMLAQPEHKS